MGPFDIGSMSLQVKYAPSRIYPFRCFIGTFNGIYRSLDYRKGNWSICGGSDKLANGVFGAVVQDRTAPDKIYACSGFNSDGGWSYSKSQGIFYSTNGGDSWTLMPSTYNTITRVSVFDGPTGMVIDNNNNLFVSSTTPGTNISQAGIFEISTTSPFTVRNVNNTLLAASDVEFNAPTGDIYASSSHESSSITPANQSSAGQLFHSTNGTNWYNLTPTVLTLTNQSKSALAALVGASNLNTLSFYWIFSTIGTTSTGSSIIYLNTACAINGTLVQQYHLIFSSTTGGTSWTYLGMAPETAGSLYNSLITADQNYPDVVYTGGNSEYKGIYNETTGAITWYNITQVTPGLTPASTITGQWEPRDFVTNLPFPGESIFNNDGGIFYTTNNTKTNTSPSFISVNGGFNSNRYYAIDLNPNAGVNQWIAASLDNGVHFTSATNGTYVLDYVQDQNATGCLFSKSNANNQVLRFEDDPNYYFKTSNASIIPINAGFTDDPNLSRAPFDWDSKSGGSNLVFTAAGQGKFGRFLAASTGVFGSVSLGSAYSNYSVSCVKVDPVSSNVVWLGLYSPNGGVPKIIRVSKANATPTIKDYSNYFTSLTGAIPTSITFEGTSNTNISVCFANTSSKRVWISTNSGSTFTNIEGNLPVGLTVNDILKVQVSSSKASSGYFIYAATSHGLWFTKLINGTSTSWLYENDLPYEDIRTICYRDNDKTMAVGTFDRGLWMTKGLNSTIALQASFTASKTILSLNEPVSFVNTSLGTTSTSTYSWDFGDGSTGSTAENPQNKVYLAPGTYTVTLTVTNGTKTSTATEIITVNSSNYAQQGLTLNWTEMGPFDLGTRINDAIYATNSTYPQRAFIASRRGIYRSLDYRNGNWQICGGTDKLPTNNFCSIVRSKNSATPETFYACTAGSTSDYSYDQSSKPCSGIYYSTNGGDTWALIPQTQTAFGVVNRMAIDQYDNLYISSITNGDDNSKVGVYRITNPLSSSLGITNVLVPSDYVAYAMPWDIQISSNGDIFVTTIGLPDNINLTTYAYTNASTGTLWVSRHTTNGNSTGTAGTWQNITPTLTSIDFSKQSVVSKPSELAIGGIVSCALTKIDPNRVYLSLGCNKGLMDGWGDFAWQAPHCILRSDNGGANWIFCSYQDQDNQSGVLFNSQIIADQSNKNVLYEMGRNGYKSIGNSKNAGMTWGTELAVNNEGWWSFNSNFAGSGFAINATGHADNRTILPNLQASGETLIFTDGGVYYSNNNNPSSGSPTFRIVNSGLNNSLLYNFDLSPTQGSYDWVAGAQDNGDLFSTSTGTYQGLNGDGMKTFFDKKNVGTLIFNFGITADPGVFYKGTTTNPSSASGIISFSNATNYSDWDSPNQLLYVGESIPIYNNSGAIIGYEPPKYGVQSFDETTNYTIPIIINGLPLNNYSVTCVKLDPHEANVIWLGLTYGSNTNSVIPKLIKVLDANTASPTFIDMTPSSFPHLPVVLLSTATINYVTLSNITFTEDGSENTNKINVCFSNVASGGRTWFCDNINATTPIWTTNDGTLPTDLSVHDMIRISTEKSESGYIVVAGTNNGVWTTSYLNGSNTIWQNDANLPAACVTEIRYRANDNTLALSTYGEGIWMSKDLSSTTSAMGFEVNSTTLDKNEPLVVYNTSIGNKFGYSWNFGDAADLGSSNTSTDFNPPSVTYTNPSSGGSTYTVTLTNSSGNMVSKQITVNDANMTLTTKNTATITPDTSASAMQNSWRVYPNPSTGIFNIAAPNTEFKNIKVTVYDMGGKVIFQNKYESISSATRIEINSHTAGVYSLEIADAKHVITTKKILISPRLGEEEEEGRFGRRNMDDK